MFFLDARNNAERYNIQCHLEEFLNQGYKVPPWPAAQVAGRWAMGDGRWISEEVVVSHRPIVPSTDFLPAAGGTL